MKLHLRKRHLIPVAAAAVVASGALLFSAGADTVPNGIAATQAYSDSISAITADFGTPGASALGTNVQVPNAPGSFIQFGATSTLNAFPGVNWSVSPIGVPFFNTGTAQLKIIPVLTGVSFTIEASELNPGLARGVAFITIAPGADSTHDSVTISLDLISLQAPVNNGTSVTFNAVDTGGSNVTETTPTNLPAGVTWSGNTLGVGTAVAGHYPLMILTAADVQGARATEGFTAVVKPFLAGVPVLYGGHAASITAARENVYVGLRNVDACLHFQIVGPGKINGHEGWVPAHIGENVAVYGGLLGNHGYTVNYEPVTGPANCAGGSTTLWPGAHTGYVFFRTS